MTGHTPKSRVTLNQAKKSPSYVLKKPTPVRKTPARKSRQSARGSREAGDGVTPRRASSYTDSRRSKRGSGNQSVSCFLNGRNRNTAFNVQLEKLI